MEKKLNSHMIVFVSVFVISIIVLVLIGNKVENKVISTKNLNNFLEQPDDLTEFGKLLNIEGKYIEAEKIFLKALEHDLSSDIIYTELSWTYLLQNKTGNYDNISVNVLFEDTSNQNLLVLNKTISGMNEETSEHILMKYYYDLSRANDAQSFLTKYKFISNSLKCSEQLIGVVNYYNMNYMVSKKHLLIGLNSTNTKDCVWSKEGHLVLSRIYQDNEQIGEAKDVLKQGLTHFPDDLSLNVHYAMVLAQLGEYDEPLHILNQLIDENPDDIVLIGELAWVYYYMEDYTKSVQLFNETLEMLWERDKKFTIESYCPYEGLGMAYYQLNNTHEANEYFNKYIEVIPQGRNNRYQHLLEFYIENKKYDEAINLVDKWLDEDPTNEFALQKYDELKDLY